MDPRLSSRQAPSGSSGGSGQDHSWMAARLATNMDILTYYAISLTGIIAIFIVGYWSRRLAGRTSRFTTPYPITALSRTVRKFSLRRLPGFTSVGHAILVSIFIALNAFFSFYRLDYSKMSYFASRFGWMATANLAFVVFLALKNTPLAILTAYSYERLNSLHQIAGYTTALYTILHGVIYTYYFITSGRIYILHEHNVTAGIVLGFSMFFTVVAGVTLRRLKYELFYIVHLVLFVIIVVTLGLHQPELGHKALIVTFLIASAWFYDRLIRVIRLAYNGINNKAAVFPLQNGGTRIVLKKPLMRARPGKHCYVWMPHVRAFETHPFSIVASDPMELVINTYSGFTRDLHRYATQNPGASLTVSVEGPYGTHPDPMEYDKVVLVAGGSGATFTVGLATDMIQRLRPDSEKQIEFIWAARSSENVAWFAQHLNRIVQHECAHKFALKLHLTQIETNKTNETLPSPIPRSPSQTSTAVASISPSPLEKTLELSSSLTLGEKYSEKLGTVEKAECIEDVPSGLPIIYGRPDVERVVREAIASTGKDKRVLVAACGPTGLVNAVRDTTASCISIDGPSVELHCEQFCW